VFYEVEFIADDIDFANVATWLVQAETPEAARQLAAEQMADKFPDSEFDPEATRVRPHEINTQAAALILFGGRGCDE
jgi:hypothetical protein